MRIGIIGAGMIGGTLAARLGELGHRVTLANSRGPHTLADFVAGLPDTVRAGTVEDATADVDVIVLAIPYGRVGELPAGRFAGKVVIDATNYYPRRDGHVAALDDGSTTSSELVAGQLPGARVVKAFNTIYFQRLRAEGRPAAPADGRLAIPVAADDGAAKRQVSELIDELGFTPVDNGPLADGRRQQPGTPVYNTPVGPSEARSLLTRA